LPHWYATADIPKEVNGEGSWQSGTGHDIPLVLVDKIPWIKLNQLSLVITSSPERNDHIAFIPTITAHGPSGATYVAPLPLLSMPSSFGFPFPVQFNVAACGWRIVTGEPIFW